MERYVANLNNGKGLQWGMEQPVAKERSLKTIAGLGDAAKKIGNDMQENQENRSGLGLLSYIWNEWISTYVILIMLLLTLIIGTGEMIHGQMLRMGERLYGDPASGMQYSFLRAEPQKPDCERHPNIDAQVQQQMQANKHDEFADFFGAASESDVRASLLAAQQLCEEKYQFYDKAMKHIESHPSLRAYRTMETTFFGIFKFGTENRTIFLLIMVFFAAITASLKIHHIGLRSPKTRVDFRVYSVAMVLGNALLTASTVSQYRSLINSGVTLTTETLVIAWLWMGLFGILTLISVYPTLQNSKNGIAGWKLWLSLTQYPFVCFYVHFDRYCIYLLYGLPNGARDLFKYSGRILRDLLESCLVYLGGYVVNSDACDGFVPEHFTSVESCT